MQAYAKLQFDFPLVSAAALAALQGALSDGGTAALQQFPITAQLVSAVEDGARSRVVDAAAPAPAPRAPAEAAVQRAFQQLAGALFAAALLQLALADDERASALLQRLELPAAHEDAVEREAVDAHADAEPTPPSLASAVEIRELDAGSSSDSDWEDLLPSAQFRQQAQGGVQNRDDGLTLAQRVDAKLAWVGSRLRYELVDMPGVWDALRLSDVLLNVLRALRARPRPCAPHLRLLVARTLCDRWLHALDATLPSVLHLLAEDAGTGEDDEAALPLWLLGCLAARAGGPAADGGARSEPGALWSLVHSSLGAVVARRAEQHALAAVARSATAADLARVAAHTEPLGVVLAFYALHAPGGIDLGDSLLPSGVARSLVSLLTTSAGAPGLTALRRAMLLACAAAPAVTAYAAAVPSLVAAMQVGDAHTALWPVILAAPDARGEAARAFSELLAAAGADIAAGATPRAAALEVLLLLGDAMRAASTRRPLWRSGGDVATALRALHRAMLERTCASDVAEPASSLVVAGGDAAAAPTSAAPVPASASELSKSQTKNAALLRAVKDVLAMGEGGTRKTD